MFRTYSREREWTAPNMTCTTQGRAPQGIESHLAGNMPSPFLSPFSLSLSLSVDTENTILFLLLPNCTTPALLTVCYNSD